MSRNELVRTHLDFAEEMEHLKEHCPSEQAGYLMIRSTLDLLTELGYERGAQIVKQEVGFLNKEKEKCCECSTK